MDSTLNALNTNHQQEDITLQKEIPPASYFKLLQEGHDVHDELTGITYKNEDFTSDGTLSKRFAYCSDTVFDENLIQNIENTDLLYHEATFCL